MTATILILIACYIWTLMVASSNPVTLDSRKAMTAPITICLILVAVLLVCVSNLLSGMDAEVLL